MDAYLYKRKRDGKVFRIAKMYEVIEILNWYEGPQYEKEYLLVSHLDGEEVITQDLLTDYDRTHI